MNCSNTDRLSLSQSTADNNKVPIAGLYRFIRTQFPHTTTIENRLSTLAIKAAFLALYNLRQKFAKQLHYGSNFSQGPLDPDEQSAAILGIANRTGYKQLIAIRTSKGYVAGR